jgi:hypothetical protein
MNRNRSGRRYDGEFKSNAVALVRGGAHNHRGGPRYGRLQMVAGTLGAAVYFSSVGPEEETSPNSGKIRVLKHQHIKNRIDAEVEMFTRRDVARRRARALADPPAGVPHPRPVYPQKALPLFQGKETLDCLSVNALDLERLFWGWWLRELANAEKHCQEEKSRRAKKSASK